MLTKVTHLHSPTLRITAYFEIHFKDFSIIAIPET